MHRMYKPYLIDHYSVGPVLGVSVLILILLFILYSENRHKKYTNLTMLGVVPVSVGLCAIYFALLILEIIYQKMSPYVRNLLFVVPFFTFLVACTDQKDHSGKKDIQSVSELHQYAPDFVCAHALAATAQILKKTHPPSKSTFDLKPFEADIAEDLGKHAIDIRSIHISFLQEEVGIDKAGVKYDPHFAAIAVGPAHIFLSTEASYVKAYRAGDRSPETVISLLATLTHEITHLAQARQKGSLERFARNCAAEKVLGGGKYNYDHTKIAELSTINVEASARIVEDFTAMSRGYESSDSNLSSATAADLKKIIQESKGL